jgi:hypothetical protein
MDYGILYVLKGFIHECPLPPRLAPGDVIGVTAPLLAYLNICIPD